MQLKGKTALIAGGGRNAGKAIATIFAREGADLILIAKERMESLQETTKECESHGAKVLPVLADLSKPEEVNRAVKQGLKKFGKIDQLVCAAAYRNHLPFFDYTYDEWLSSFAINVHAPFYLARAVLPGMLERKSGNIIALGSTLSLTSRKNEALSTACKHSLYGFIKSIAAEFTPSGIRANFLILASMENKRADAGKYHWEAAGDPTIGPSGKRSLPMGRKGTPEEVANVALFLASDQSSYISGDRILCVGGKYI